MPGRERRSVLAIVAGALAMVLAWIEARGGHTGVSAFVLRGALVALLIGPAAVLPNAFRSRHPGVALSYGILLGGAFAAAGAWLERTNDLVLAGAYYAVPGIFIALSIGLLPVHWQDRRRGARAARERDARERVDRIHWGLRTGSAVVEDAQIVEAMDALAAALPSDQHEASAAILFGAVSRIAARRPALAEALLAPPLDRLARLGVRRAETVFHWLDPELLPWTRVETDEAGREWLDTALPGQVEMVQRLLDMARAAAPRKKGRTAPGPRILLADALTRAGRWEEAGRLYDELIEEGDPHGLHRFARARAGARGGDPAEALALLGDETRPAILRARLAALAGERDRALELLTDALLENPMLSPDAEPDFESLAGDPDFQRVLGHRYVPNREAEA